MYKNIKLYQAILILISFTIFLLFNGKFFQANHKNDAIILHHRLRQNDIVRPFSSHSYNVSNHFIYQILSTLKYLNITSDLIWTDHTAFRNEVANVFSQMLVSHSTHYVSFFYNILIHRPQDPISFCMRLGQKPVPTTDMKTLWTIACVI